MVQAKDEEAQASIARALSLQHLAAGSAVLSEASQLSVAAQQCNTRAEQAAQMALLARAEAARLSGTALPPGAALPVQVPAHAAGEAQVNCLIHMCLQCLYSIHGRSECMLT